MSKRLVSGQGSVLSPPQSFLKLLGQGLVSHWPHRYSNVFPTLPGFERFYWALVPCWHFEPGWDHFCGNCVKDIYLSSGVMLRRKNESDRFIYTSSPSSWISAQPSHSILDQFKEMLSAFLFVAPKWFENRVHVSLDLFTENMYWIS